MKKYLAILSFILIGISAHSQDFEAPKKGAKIYAKDYVINVDSGDETTFDLWIVRSKMAKKSKFGNPTLRSSSGLTFNVEQDANNNDHFIVTVSADEVEVGEYFTMVSAKSSGTQKVTGTTLSFNITPAKTVASKDGE